MAPAPPYTPQDEQETAEMIRGLNEGIKSGKSGKGGFRVKKNTFAVDGSPDGIQVDSWKFGDWDYKRRDLPTYARGLFTTRNRRNKHEIAVRGYDKFFNVGEVPETEWKNVMTRTQGPYELTLKENGCIIFVSGLEDETLLVCSKHSTGERNGEVSHASAGVLRIEKQLAALGKTKADLARELRRRNVTAVAELCDDSFEEHILAYGPDSAGLYLHGMNLNLPKFATYSSESVQQFADEWGFRKTGLIVMDDIAKVRAFLEEVAETGAHDGRDVEGFVIRCRMSHDPSSVPYRDWFFKYKFEEPYLMYRQWRECTKSMISGKPPKYKKHKKITEQYLLYAQKRLAADPKLAKLYNQNHGIIGLRNDFLAYKNLKGSAAAHMEDSGIPGDVKTEVKGDVVLVPIATIGCGKTTVAVALTHLFDWGHVQNDNLTGKAKKPPRFTRAIIDLLGSRNAVIADRNNSSKHERKQIITDTKIQHANARLVALHFVHNTTAIDEIRKVTQERVVSRGDNHQTIHAATDTSKFVGIMEGFISRFEPCNRFAHPDNGFDAVIDLDPVADSRTNLETVIKELHRIYPNLVPEIPSAERMDEAINFALGYKPTIKHDIPDRKKNFGPGQSQGQSQSGAPKKKPLEYLAVNVPAKDVNAILEKAFQGKDAASSRFYTQLKKTRRVQPKFHVTLMHRASAKESPALWERYNKLQAKEAEATGESDAKLGDCGVMLERIVYDDRVMSIVVRLVDEEGKWECVNKVAHITVGTREDSIKPKESNTLLAKWLEEDAAAGGDSNIHDIVIEDKPIVPGTVRGVCNSFTR